MQKIGKSEAFRNTSSCEENYSELTNQSNNGQNKKPSFSSEQNQTFKRESSILAQDERWRRA